MSDDTPIRIGVWGTTNVGKTTLLATALFSNDASLARLKLDGSVNEELFDVHKRLRSNRLPLPTAEERLFIRATGRGGAPVEVVDMRGGLALQIQDPRVREMVHSSAAMLFLIEYDGVSTGLQLAAVEAAMLDCGSKPVALAMTKCERWLADESELWDVPSGWLAETPLWATHQNTLRRFEGKAWPTSAFGYDPQTSLPAVMLTEMGALVPFNIRPRNVTKPLAFLLDAAKCL